MLDSINEKTKSIIQVWKKFCGSIAPDVYTELSKTSFEMIEVMTEKLSLWKDKSLDTGDKVLLYSCLGCIVEAWFRFFYCVYYNEYKKAPFRDRYNQIKSRKNLRSEEMIDYSIDKLFTDKNDDLYLWSNKIRKLRNSIHIFNVPAFDDCDYEKDIRFLNDFIEMVWNQLPPIEDCVDERFGNWD